MKCVTTLLLTVMVRVAFILINYVFYVYILYFQSAAVKVKIIISGYICIVYLYVYSGC